MEKYQKDKLELSAVFDVLNPAPRDTVLGRMLKRVLNVLSGSYMLACSTVHPSQLHLSEPQMQ